MILPRTSRPLTILPITVREVRVTQIEDLSPNMRRLTLAGPQLAAGARDGFPVAAFASAGFDDHVKLIVPGPEDPRPHPGRQNEDRFEWAPGVLPLSRDYTVRRVAPDGDSFQIDVVRHDAGRASDWAFGCRIGDPISFAGPKMSAGVAPDIDWHLLIGDITALPAIGRWLEEAPAGARARVLIEIPTEQDRQEIGTAADPDITWLVRDPGVRPGHSIALLEAVRALEPWPGRVYAWCAGESLTIAPIRRYLRNELGIDKADVEVVGYWRRVTDAPRTDKPIVHEPAPDRSAADDGPDQPAMVDRADDKASRTSGGTPSPLELSAQVHEMSELLPPIALRVAVTLRIPELVDEGTGDAVGLSAATGVPQQRLQPLLDALESLGLLRAVADGYHNTALGEVLLEESSQDSLDLGNPANQAELALVELLPVLQTGATPDAPLLPAAVPAWRAADETVDDAFQAQVEDRLQWNLQPLGKLDAVATARTLLVLGDGAALTAIELATPEKRVHLLVPNARIESTRTRLEREAGAARGRIHLGPLDSDPFPAADVAVALLVQDSLPDDAARDLAMRLRRTCGHVVFLTQLADDAATDDHVAAASLTQLVHSGMPLRTSAAATALLESAGLREIDCQPLGWGFGPSVITAAGTPLQ